MLSFCTENESLHHRQLRFPYKDQLVIAIKEAVCIYCEKPLHSCENVKPRSFWQCLLLFLPELSLHYRIGLPSKMMVVMRSKTIALPKVLNGCDEWCPPFVKNVKTRVREYAKNYLSCVNSGFRREVDEICALLGSYAASSGDFLSTFRDNISVHLQGSTNWRQ